MRLRSITDALGAVRSEPKAQAFPGSIASTLFLAAALLASASCATKKTIWAEPGELGTARLRAVLARGTSVEELLAVERELARVQTEIDQLDGQLTRLRASVAMSTISLTLQPEPEPEARAKPRILGPLGAAWWVVKESWVVRE